MPARPARPVTIAPSAAVLEVLAAGLLLLPGGASSAIAAGNRVAAGTWRCRSASISRTRYRRTDATHHPALIGPLQCLLKQQYLYSGAVSGRWDVRTLTALHAYQDRAGHRRRGHASRSDGVSLLAAGSSDRVLRRGANGADVVRLRRALNAAGPGGVRVTGHFNASTRRAVNTYQDAVLGHATGVVAELTRHAQHGGRR